MKNKHFSFQLCLGYKIILLCYFRETNTAPPPPPPRISNGEVRAHPEFDELWLNLPQSVLGRTVLALVAQTPISLP